VVRLDPETYLAGISRLFSAVNLLEEELHLLHHEALTTMVLVLLIHGQREFFLHSGQQYKEILLRRTGYIE